MAANEPSQERPSEYGRYVTPVAQDHGDVLPRKRLEIFLQGLKPVLLCA
jgi:hypothetical protein